MSRSSATSVASTINNANSSILDRPLGKIIRNNNNQGETVVSLSGFGYLFSEIVQYHQNRVGSISELERRLESNGYNVGLKVLELSAYRIGNNISTTTMTVGGIRQSSTSINSSSSNNPDYKREIKLMNILQFISTTVWKSLFGKVADSLERSIDHADEFMIVDYSPITSTYVSVPADFGGLSVDAYISGIVAGLLEGSGFPARVTAHSVALEEGEQVPIGSTGGTNSATGGGSGGLGSNYNNNNSTSSSAAMFSPSYSISDLTGTPILPPRKDKTVFLVKFAQSVLTRDSLMG